MSNTSDILLSLARHTFPNDIVIAALPVKKPDQKKVVRPSLYFVITKSRSRLSDVHVQLVKRSDKGDACKRKKAWPLGDVRRFDGVSTGDLDVELTLSDGKRRWTCFSHRDKLEFAKKLLHTARQLRHCHVKFENFSPALYTVKQQRPAGDDSLLLKTFADAESLKTATDDTLNGFEGLSEKEALDLQEFLDANNESVQNAENFVKKLNDELRELEVSNIHALISSGAQVNRLTRTIESAVGEVEKLDARVQDYGGRLQGVSASLAVLADRDKLARLSAANQRKAADRLSQLVKAISFPDDQKCLLRSPNFGDGSKLQQLHEAAVRCDAVLAAGGDAELRSMDAVQKTLAEVAELKKAFSNSLKRHLNSAFITYANRHGGAAGGPGSSGSGRFGRIAFPSHAESKRDLLRLAALMAWLKANYVVDFNELQGRYAQQLAKAYEQEAKEVAEAAMAAVGPVAKERTRMGTLRATGSNSSLNRDDSRRGGGGGGGGGGAGHENSDEAAAAGNLERVFTRVLDALEPTVEAEEDFSTSFFDLSSEASKPELDKLLNAIFKSMDGFLDTIVGSLYSASPEFSASMLVAAAERSDRQTGRQRFLGHLHAQLCLRAKQKFDAYVDQMIRGFQEFKPNKKSRCGIVGCIKTYENFAASASVVFKNSKRLPDLERAHEKLVTALMQLVDRVAVEHGKTPPAVVLMENCHRLESIVRSQRMQRLDSLRLELNEKCRKNREEYVRACLGKPLEKLSDFFDGVDRSLARGVKAEEVGYQMQFSRNELKKLIREYPAKDVKRGLEHLRKKVDKQLCEEENLSVVVWHEMQQVFLKQYNAFNSLIARCYPTANLQLEFSDADILRFFAEIADRSSP